MKIQQLLFLVLLVLSLVKRIQCQSEVYSPLQVPYKIQAVMKKFQPTVLDFYVFVPDFLPRNSLICFQKKQPPSQDNGRSCFFSPIKDNYSCVNVSTYSLRGQNKSSINIVSIVLQNSQNRQLLNNVRISNIEAKTNDLSFQLQQYDQFEFPKFNVTNFFELNSIYQVKTCTGYSKQTGSTGVCRQLRTNFLHTYLHKNLVNNLLMQRNVQCFQQQDKNIYIFSGGVVRQSRQYFFVAFIIQRTSGKLGMWGGFSYNKDHTSSDMASFSTSSQFVLDMYSLYASSPFQDTATNINGTDDLVTIGSSYFKSEIQPNYLFRQYYRLYDTRDTVSDEIIRIKITMRFCFAGYFYDAQQSQEIPFLSPSNRQFKHQILFCWRPNISLHLQNLKTFHYFLLSFVLLISF